MLLQVLVVQQLLRRAPVMPRAFGTATLIIAALFALAGVAAVFGPAGLVLAIIMSIVEAFWILAAAVALARAYI